MTELIIACIRTGTAYSIDYVTKLRNTLSRHLPRPYMLVCLTDQPERRDGIEFIDITETGLQGEWAKMLLFEPSWREGHKTIYFELDTAIVGDLSPLADVPGEVAIHDSVMVIGANMASFIWTAFDRSRDALMGETFKLALKHLHPDAPSLQRLLPKGFFVHDKIVGGVDGSGLHRIVLAPS